MSTLSVPSGKERTFALRPHGLMGQAPRGARSVAAGLQTVQSLPPSTACSKDCRCRAYVVESNVQCRRARAEASGALGRPSCGAPWVSVRSLAEPARITGWPRRSQPDFMLSGDCPPTSPTPSLNGLQDHPVRPGDSSLPHACPASHLQCREALESGMVREGDMEFTACPGTKGHTVTIHLETRASRQWGKALPGDSLHQTYLPFSEVENLSGILRFTWKMKKALLPTSPMFNYHNEHLGTKTQCCYAFHFSVTKASRP